MKIIRGIPQGETQIGVAGSPHQVLQQRIGDEEGLFAIRRWGLKEQLPLNSEDETCQILCKTCKAPHSRHPLCCVEQCPRKDTDNLK